MVNVLASTSRALAEGTVLHVHSWARGLRWLKTVSSTCILIRLYKRLKLKLRVFLAGHSVAMVTYCVTEIIPTCSPVIGQFFDTRIVASSDKEWL